MQAKLLAQQAGRLRPAAPCTNANAPRLDSSVWDFLAIRDLYRLRSVSKSAFESVEKVEYNRCRDGKGTSISFCFVRVIVISCTFACECECGSQPVLRLFHGQIILCPSLRTLGCYPQLLT